MGRRGLTTFAVGMTAGAAAYAVLTTGALASGASGIGSAVGSLFRVPAAAADELPAFDDCEQLRQWYVDRALPLVGPYGFGGGSVVYGTMRAEASGAVPMAGAATDDAVGSSGTGTNVQEADVDESDIAKTDGRLVVRLLGDRLVVTDVSGSRPVELARTRLPGRALTQPELLLDGDRVLVVGSEGWNGYGPATEGRMIAPGPVRLESASRVIGYDLSDPSSPRVTSNQRVDGGIVSTREYAGGTVRLVLTNGYPPLDFVQPNRDRSEREATRRNKQIVREASVSQWLPGIRSGSGAKKQLLGCDQVRHPKVASGFGTISVLTFGIDDPTSYDATAVSASGDLAYSSADRLYVATVRGGWSEPVPMDADTPRTSVAVPKATSTEVHAFALDGDRTTYVASGRVPGTVKDRWSFSEHDGSLRVATALGNSWQPRENAVVVLDEVGGRLREVGRVDGLGRDEQIQSVRWLGDLAVVVTFRQTDPLYTLDLSDPTRPRLVGALKIPGYSTYLHPVGGDRLVGIGYDADQLGGRQDAQAATFDLADLAHVTRTDTLSLGHLSDVSAGLDPRTFSYLPEQRVLLTPVQDWEAQRAHFVAVRVGEDGSLSEIGSWVTRRYAGTDVRTLPLGGGRVALVGDVVRVVDVR